MWDCRLHSDIVSQEPPGVHGSSSRNWMDTTHHHSVSDGALSFSDSPPDNVHCNRWTSPLPKFELSSIAAGGSRAQPSWLPRSAERPFPVRANAVIATSSPSLGSSSPLSESGQWELTSTSKRTSRSFNTRRSHTSKAVYPLMFRNPVSDYDADSTSFGQVTPSSSSGWPDNSPGIDYKFHKTLMELHETSPDPSASSRRDGFRWSSASSYDTDIVEQHHQHQDLHQHQVDLESNESSQKCGVCGKLLWQRSPWSSNRIMRGGCRDMPTAGVLHCAHVFHAECLEQVTPKTHVHDPPCPVCSKTIGESAAEPLQMALRSIRRNRGLVSDDHNNNSSKEESSSSLTSRLKRHFAMKGRSGKSVVP
ncbi:hypothetical protein LINPERPRIM_LOCUS14280 [Linum perenne]